MVQHEDAPVRFVLPPRLQPVFAGLRDQFLSLTRRGKKNQRLIGVTAVHSRAGASTVAAGLAVTLARMASVRVLLVDAHLERPIQHRVFGLDRSPGLVEGVLGAGPVGLPVTASLDVLPAGEWRPGDGVGFEAEAFQEALRSWRGLYTYTLFDLPSLESGGESLRLAGVLDGMILVLQAERTRWADAAQARERLLRAGASVLGAVLNRQIEWVPRALRHLL